MQRVERLRIKTRLDVENPRVASCVELFPTAPTAQEAAHA